MSRRFVLFCVLGALMTVATSSEAFDGQRKGFILGFGAGPAVTSFTQTIGSGGASITGDRENKLGVGTDFLIGFGINEQILLYYVNRVSWFSMDNALGSSVTIASSVGLLGASYYFQEASPTPYIRGLIGLSSWSTPFESDSDTWTGLGLGAGIGYEFSPHWSLEGNLDYGNPSDTVQGIEATTNAISFHFAFHALAY